MTVAELEPQIATLSRSERVQLAQRLLSDLTNSWPGVEKTPGVAGGDARIVRTRIPVWTLINYRRLGWSESQILDNFPSLRAIDLVNAWSYADAHTQEIDQAILENETA